MHTDSDYAPSLAERGTGRMPVDQGMAARLRWARENSGFMAVADAIRAFEWPGVYHQHENGLRGFAKHARKYARAYRVREEWLRYGQGLPRASMRGIVVGGVVGAFGIIIDEVTPPMPRDEAWVVEEPPGDGGEYVAYRVDGDLNYPSFFSGDVIYAGKAVDPRLVVGRQCVATMADGTKRVCILALGPSQDRYMLFSINATPELLDGTRVPSRGTQRP